MKKTLLIALLCTICYGAFAQMPYAFSTYTQSFQKFTPYTDTGILSSEVWDIFYTTPSLPSGFNFKLNGVATTKFNLFNNELPTGSFGFNGDATNPAAFLMDFELADRNYYLPAGTTASPITYKVKDTAGHKIYIAQFINAGFRKEFDVLHTLNDSMDLQIWLYDSTNIVEFHFGNSKITNASIYFNAAAPAIGYTNDDLGTDAATSTFYYLTGDPTAPTIDSTNISTFPTTTLSSFPASGTVYRFAPAPSGLAVASVGNKIAGRVYPTLCSNILYADCNDAAIYEVTAITGGNNISGNLQKGTNTLNVNNLTPGNYLLRITNASGTQVVKFTKL